MQVQSRHAQSLVSFELKTFSIILMEAGHRLFSGLDRRRVHTRPTSNCASQVAGSDPLWSVSF